MGADFIVIGHQHHKGFDVSHWEPSTCGGDDLLRLGCAKSVLVSVVYKNIHELIAAQHDLVSILDQFDPRLVKMAPQGERAED